jgi:hypothetical protein
MKITVYKAKLHTAGKTAEQILKDYSIGPTPGEQVVKGIIKAYEFIDGIEVAVSDAFFDKGYSLIEWYK